VISDVSNFDKIVHGGVDVAFRPMGEIKKMVKMEIRNKILAIKQQY